MFFDSYAFHRILEFYVALTGEVRLEFECVVTGWTTVTSTSIMFLSYYADLRKETASLMKTFSTMTNGNVYICWFQKLSIIRRFKVGPLWYKLDSGPHIWGRTYQLFSIYISDYISVLDKKVSHSKILWGAYLTKKRKMAQQNKYKITKYKKQIQNYKNENEIQNNKKRKRNKKI